MSREDFRKKYVQSLRWQLADIERCLRIKEEDVAILHAEKADTERKLQKLKEGDED